MEGCIYGVSLGPGDPDLITIKALRLIKTADRVYYPGTVGAGGRVGGVAIGILEAYSIPEDRMSGMLVPMSRHRDAAESCYEENYGRIAADARAGKRVVVVSVGDSGFFSTCTAILERAVCDGIATEMVPGIPAFIAAGSSVGMPLALQNDRVLVLAQLDDIELLDKYVKKFETVVVMKLSTLKNGLVKWLERSGGPFLYAEKVGMEGEFTTMDINALCQRDIPYFSMLVCSRHCMQSKLYKGNICREK